MDDLRFARAHTARPLKMAVPGPMTIVDTTYDEAYGDEEALALDVAAALNQELLDLQAAGCDVVQIDEPAMTRYHEKVAAYGARALDRCVAGVTIPTIVHLCYGYPGPDPRQHEYEYPELLELLMQTGIGGFSVEFARSGYDPAILAACEGRLVMFGCVDPRRFAPRARCPRRGPRQGRPPSRPAGASAPGPRLRPYDHQPGGGPRQGQAPGERGPGGAQHAVTQPVRRSSLAAQAVSRETYVARCLESG